MYTVSGDEHLFYSDWKKESEKQTSDSIAISDKRLYHFSPTQNNTHTCVNIKDIKMVKFTTKKIKQDRKTLKFILNTLIGLVLISSIVFYFLSDIVKDFLATSAPNFVLPGGVNSLLLIPAVIIIFLLFALFSTKYVTRAVMVIEYSSGSKVDIVMKVLNDDVMYLIRNAIFTAIDYAEDDAL